MKYKQNSFSLIKTQKFITKVVAAVVPNATAVRRGGKSLMKNQKGFSLVEILVVVVVVGIIVAIAVPNMIASRRFANEGSAVSMMRTLHSGNISYQSSLGKGKFAPNIQALKIAGLVDGTVSTATTSTASKSGYIYTYDSLDVNDNPSNYNIIAKPASTEPITATGTQEFFIDGTGVIRSAPTGVSSTSPPFERK